MIKKCCVQILVLLITLYNTKSISADRDKHNRSTFDTIRVSPAPSRPFIGGDRKESEEDTSSQVALQIDTPRDAARAESGPRKFMRCIGSVCSATKDHFQEFWPYYFSIGVTAVVSGIVGETIGRENAGQNDSWCRGGTVYGNTCVCPGNPPGPH